MATWDGISQGLHEQLTGLLMENGAAVTKKSIDELIKWVALRDQKVMDKVIRDAEKTHQHLQDETRIAE